MKYYLSFSLLLFIFLQSCQEEVPLNSMKFYWDSAHCYDPWHTYASETEREILKDVEDYLKEEGIRGAKGLSITNDAISQGCYACHCTTGRRINLLADRNQKNKMVALGFKQSN